MMKEVKMAVVSFTPNGKRQAEKLMQCIVKQQGEESYCMLHSHKPENLKEWCHEQFKEQEVILFISAMGIAVRTIAPFLQNKQTDPAVLVMDEQAKHVISVLSGHLGGGNEWTLKLSALLGADPVITTASDVNEKIAIDVFAKKNHLSITDMQMAKKIAAKIVAGEGIHFTCKGKVAGRIPKELGADEQEAKGYILVSPFQEPEKANQLILVPEAFIMGIGCKKGKSAQEIEHAVQEVLNERKLSLQGVCKMASIDLKAEEKGLLEFADKYNIETFFYSSKELRAVPGDYTTSSFVNEITGVDNVCERAAMCLALEEDTTIEKEKAMRIHKVKKEGITIALLERKWGVRFE